MNRINLGRVAIGGLLAGFIINLGEFVFNGVLFREQMDAAMVALNKPPVDNSMIIVFVAMGFGLGFTLVWTYAAIRARFGPGVKTAVCAASLVWGLAYLYPNIFMIVTRLFPRDMIVMATVWGLVEVIIAGIAGAWAYTEL
jgi:positive regulator of sigma E activity